MCLCTIRRSSSSKRIRPTGRCTARGNRSLSKQRRANLDDRFDYRTVWRRSDDRENLSRSISLGHQTVWPKRIAVHSLGDSVCLGPLVGMQPSWRSVSVQKLSGHSIDRVAMLKVRRETERHSWPRFGQRAVYSERAGASG